MPSTEPVYEIEFLVGPDAVDGNGHVNNVEYIRWMQEAAANHSDHVGCTDATTRIGAAWVVRSHHIEYFLPSHEGDTLAVRTWISNARRVRSMRQYRFVHRGTGHIIANARTEWILVDASTGRPQAIPEDILALFHVIPEDAPR